MITLARTQSARNECLCRFKRTGSSQDLEKDLDFRWKTPVLSTKQRGAVPLSKGVYLDNLGKQLDIIMRN